ncbi:ABC transporter ATP-binding protein [Pelagibacterium halotolerans]|uniref:Maltose/maltodextrin transport ATP-binding protein MalK n=1 Tax=Pelagibacterium halotolerans (strain DSM 22347 / JCM 15775 / CGMCC 1.7692 / B2) TaxID=1082931 RepID=G4R7F2_PELHB|nr:sn-glycerol-3-phosphate ABC transporter ATP-binding protein UgpC [Pelagibacterium halotolerans]AEQ51290.1 maltose/maltodextrin transport ATP-binding protein MalK [Pelagibacterium halotolerans B2]QJR18853.1 sn-glycerol-3-phosphate ABC transporter ATP-binding protein UgpC [Pelagibacterium halotolerans]SEA66337.1 carbohydrate ABC transporter ATP-binding protein, CUT1 family [Pelagibacterium halotolerans]
MASITFQGVTKRYAGGIRAVDSLDLEIREGEFMVIVGPSGCGKTTALRMAAGLEEISEGRLLIGDRVVNDVSARDRDIAMVFQSYALYPHMTIAQNIAFPLESQKLAKAEIEERVRSAARTLGLEDYLDRLPRQLSGGQRQRVAMGRAIVRRPQAFLMDEPLSNLDAKLRTQMRTEIIELQRRLGVSTLYVTHDQVEAMTMGHRIAIMRKGVLQQAGTPLELYDAPANLFVAAFIGSPAMNLVGARLVEDGRTPALDIGDQRLSLGAHAERFAGVADRYGQEVVVGIRPEHLQVPGDGNQAWPQLRARMRMVEELPPEKMVHVTIAGQPVTSDTVVEAIADSDKGIVQDLQRQADAAEVSVIARMDIEKPLPSDGEFALSLNTARLHLFDPRTGATLV